MVGVGINPLIAKPAKGLLMNEPSLFSQNFGGGISPNRFDPLTREVQNQNQIDPNSLYVGARMTELRNPTVCGRAVKTDPPTPLSVLLTFKLDSSGTDQRPLCDKSVASQKSPYDPVAQLVRAHPENG